MRRSCRLLALCLTLLSVAAVVQAQTVVDPGLNITTIAAPGLSQPTGMAFLDDNSIFVIEKASGEVKHIAGGTSTSVLTLGVNSDSERGLLGITLHPDFATNHFAYLYYSVGDEDNWVENRLSRFTWNGTNLVDEVDLYSFDFDATQNNGANHDGGPLTFGPDGNLYGITGDLNRNRAEQNNQGAPGATSSVGGVFRFTDTGAIPADNPFVGVGSGDPFALWYAYGIRNSFGLAFDPATGNLWDTENGPGSYDEINLVAEGFNSGWDAIMGPDARDSSDAPDDLVVLPGSAYSDPEFSWLTPVAVTSLQFLVGSALGSAYDDAVLVGANNTQDLYLFRLNDARDGFELTGGLADLVADSSSERDALLFGDNFGVVTDIEIGPDGAVYVLSLSDGAIYRIAAVPEPSAIVLALAGAAAILGWRRVRSP